jgi:hypothetical protein
MLASMTFMLVACGGGSNGGSSPPPTDFPPPPGPSAQDLANAQNARVHMTQGPHWLTIT